MTDKKLTDAEIIKALECCANYKHTKCKGCPLGEDCINVSICGLALDLINRLQAKKDDLERIVGLMNKRKHYRKFVDEVYRKQKGKELCDPDFDYIYQLYFEQQAEIERLQNILMCFMDALGKVRKIDDIEEISLIPIMSELNKQYRIELKAEAYKEFAEKLENRILSMLTTATLEEKEIICACIGIKNNVLKEMGGEDNAKYND